MNNGSTELLEMDSRMFEKKQRVDSLHQEIAEYFYPEKANFTSEIQIGSEFASHLTDFYPVLVRRELADQIGSMVRPSDRNWFEATVESKQVRRDQASKEFLEFMTDVNRGLLYSRDSGFRRCAKELENDYSAFGMGVVHCTYSSDRSSLIYTNYHLKDCAVEVGENGQVNHLHRKCDMKAKSMLKQFGEDKLPTQVKEALKNKDSKTDFKVRHIVIPLDKYEPTRKFPKSAKWADIYMTEGGHILKELPSVTFDYVVPRWQTVAGQVYAFSPATIVALPQARMLQRMMETLIEGAERRVDPPLVATADVIASPISLAAGHITYIDADYDERMGQGLRPLDLGKDTGLGDKLIGDSRNLLVEAFYINKLAPLANREKQVTAYEASQLVDEYVRTALPLFEPLEDEWTGALLDLTTVKAMRAGAYGPVDANGVPEDLPDALLGSSIDFEFNNSLKEARNRQVINGFVESSDLIARAAQLDPSVPAEVDTRTMFRDTFGSVPGSSADWLNSEKEADELRKQSAEAAQAQQEVAEIDQGAQVAQNVGNAAQALEGVL